MRKDVQNSLQLAMGDVACPVKTEFSHVSQSSLTRIGAVHFEEGFIHIFVQAIGNCSC